MRLNFSALVNRISTEGFTMFFGVFLLFLLINFNAQLGLIYALMLIMNWIIFQNRKPYFFPLEKDERRLGDVVLGLAGYAVFVIASALIVGAVGLVWQNLAASTPILEKSSILTFIGWGIVIPCIETPFFFGGLMNAFADRLNVRLSLASVWSWLIFVFISALFAAFHLTAKAVGQTVDINAMLMTFTFGIISCIIVTMTQEMAAATYLHITSNSIASAISLKVKFLQSLLPGL
jgi:hypothetical protein